MIEFSPLCLRIDTVKPFVDRIESHIDSLHFDIIDDSFSKKNSGFSPKYINEYETSLPKHVHAMVANPEHLIDQLDNVASFSFHMKDLVSSISIIQAIQKRGIAAGIVIDSKSSLKDVQILGDLVDRIIVLAVVPATFGGQYIEAASDILKKVKLMSLSKQIYVDGGISTFRMAKDVKELGANGIILGSIIANSMDPITSIINLRRELK